MIRQTGGWAVGRDLHQIQIFFLGEFHRIERREDTNLMPSSSITRTSLARIRSLTLTFLLSIHAPPARMPI